MFSYNQTKRPQSDGSRGHKHGYKMLICIVLVVVVSLIITTGNLDEIISLL